MVLTVINLALILTQDLMALYSQDSKNESLMNVYVDVPFVNGVCE